MNPHSSPILPPPVDAPAARRIDAVCRRFETAWRLAPDPQARPQLEEALPQLEPALQPRLLYELIALEHELLGPRAPAADAYQRRFPHADPRLIAHALTPPDPDFADHPTLPTQRPAADAPSPRPKNAPPTPEAPVRFGPYELLGEIARGGMGVVYRARQPGLDRVVALKQIILAGPYADPAAQARFYREAQAVARLDHPNIVPIYDVGQAEGHAYFTMKLIDGYPLSRWKDVYRHDPRRIARLLATVATAVAAAHRQGFLHRDLKPANILIDASGAPHVADFGLARPLAPDASSLTESGAVLGTAAYMAPEQAAGHAHRLTPRADIYSLGAILYELLTGRPPFQAATTMETLVHVLEVDPVPPRQIDPAIPRPLEEIALRCLEKAPERRYESAQALADDLERFLRDEPVAAGRHRWTDALRRWTRREPELATRAGALAIVALLTHYNRSQIPLADRRDHVHWSVMLLLAAWAAASYVLHLLRRRYAHAGRTRAVDAVRLAWTTADVLLYTAILAVLDASRGPLVIGYPLLIAASGLWARASLVWATTALAALAFAFAYYALDVPSHATDPRQYPNVVLATILVTGFVVAHQVRRFWALATYYEGPSSSTDEPAG